MFMKKSLNVLLSVTMVLSLSIPVSAAANNQVAAKDKILKELKVEPQKFALATTNQNQDQLKENTQDSKEKKPAIHKQTATKSKWSFKNAWKKFKESKLAKFWTSFTEKSKKFATNIAGTVMKYISPNKELAKGDSAKKDNTDLIKQAQKFNVDITGLSEKEAWDKIKKAEEKLYGNSDGKSKDDLINQAKKFNVEIIGLSEKDAWNKIKKAEEELNNKSNGNGSEDLIKQAQKFNVDITGLSVEEAWSKIKQAEKNLRSSEQAAQDQQRLAELQPTAQRLGVDITGLSYEEAFKKVNAANDAANWQGVLRAAADYGVNVKGLTLEQAEAKIREARAEDQGVNIDGLSPQDAEALLEATKNNQMTPEGVLLQNTCGLLKLNSNATVKVMKEQVSSKLGINLTGLSLEEEANKIKESLAKLGLTLP